MDAELAAKVGALLADPEAVAKISSIASSLGADRQSAPDAAKSAQPDPRISLLIGLKAVMRDDKKQKIDMLINALTAVSAVKRFGGGKNDIQP